MSDVWGRDAQRPEQGPLTHSHQRHTTRCENAGLPGGADNLGLQSFDRHDFVSSFKNMRKKIH